MGVLVVSPSLSFGVAHRYWLELDGTQVPWSNGRVQVWGKENTRQIWDILSCPKARKYLKMDGVISKNNRARMKGLPLAKMGQLEY